MAGLTPAANSTAAVVSAFLAIAIRGATGAGIGAGVTCRALAAQAYPVGSVCGTDGGMCPTLETLLVAPGGASRQASLRYLTATVLRRPAHESLVALAAVSATSVVATGRSHVAIFTLGLAAVVLPRVVVINDTHLPLGAVATVGWLSELCIRRPGESTFDGAAASVVAVFGLGNAVAVRPAVRVTAGAGTIGALGAGAVLVTVPAAATILAFARVSLHRLCPAVTVGGNNL